MQALEALCRSYRASMRTPWHDLDEDFRHAILYGTGDREITFTYDEGPHRFRHDKPFEGVLANLERRWKQTESDWLREELGRYQTSKPCEVCGGKRLKPEALAVKVGRLDISEVSRFSIKAAGAWFRELPKQLR